MSPEETKAKLAELLKREPTVSEVTVNGTKGYLVDYINHRAPATKLVADTPEGAIDALFVYLSATAETLLPTDATTD